MVISACSYLIGWDTVLRTYGILLIVCELLLVACLIHACKSTRIHAHAVRNLVIAVMFPVIGSLLIVCPAGHAVNVSGYYLYLLGTSWILYFFVELCASACSLSFRHTVFQKVLLGIVILDSCCVLLNLAFLPVFTTEILVLEDGSAYLSLISLPFHFIHLIVSYGLFFVGVGLVVYKIAKSSYMHMERYVLILVAPLIVIIWNAFYIFSHTPIDVSIIGYALCAIFVSYLMLDYRPYFARDRMLSHVISDMTVALILFDPDKKCIYANDMAKELLGITDIDADDLRQLMNERVGAPLLDWKGTVRTTLSVNGHIRHFNVTQQRVDDKRGKPIGTAFTAAEVTNEVERAEANRYAATHDELTGLYNKSHFIELVRERLDTDLFHEYVIVSSNINDFKIINDVFGDAAGDRVLIAIAQAMRERATKSTIYCRLAADRFAMLLRKGNFRPEDFVNIPRDIIHLREDVLYPAVVYVGAYEIVDRNLPVALMLDRTTMAIGDIKDDFNTRVAIYDDSTRKRLVWEHLIIGSFDEAMQTGQILPYLQPQVSADGQVRGAEALVRWNHPTEGFMPPDKFIPLFERNGMIAQLDEFLWDSACGILRQWKDAGHETYYLSVNISPKDFYFIDVYETLTRLVNSHGIDPHNLRLEITEASMMEEMKHRLDIIDRLRDAGFVVEMDDFGSGYSSLNMLKEISFDILKIDMAFLYDSKEKTRAEKILKSVIDLSKCLNMPTVTEGVETNAQVTMLIDMGCECFQGYYFSEPISQHAFEDAYFEGDGAQRAKTLIDEATRAAQ